MEQMTAAHHRIPILKLVFGSSKSDEDEATDCNSSDARVPVTDVDCSSRNSLFRWSKKRTSMQTERLGALSDKYKHCENL